MGCTSSKHAQRKAGPDGQKAPFPRAVTMPTVYHLAEREGDSHHMVALTSTSYGVLRVGNPADDDKSGSVGLKVGRDDPSEGIDVLGSWLASASKQSFAGMSPQTVEKESKDPETINTWDLMRGLESRSPSPAKSNPSSLGRRMVNRSMSVLSVDELDSSLGMAGSLKLFLWRKYLQGYESSGEKVPAMEESLMTPPAKSRFSLLSPSSARSNGGSASSCLSRKDWAERASGLKLLLSPLNLSCSSTSGSTLIKKPSVNGHTALKSDLESDHETFMPSELSQSSPRKSSKPLISGGEDRESNSPLFDPVLLATFEKALESACESKLDSTNGSTTSSSSCTSFSSETNSDEESSHAEANRLEGSACHWESSLHKCFVVVQQENVDDCDKEFSISEISPLTAEEEDWKRLESLESYELLCPPGGQSSVVLYFTSLRGVRKTFEDCCSLRIILRGLRMHMDERDVWMHSKFKDELADLLGKGVVVPRLFIRGRYIGGAEEVKQLHEDGVLMKLLDGFLMESSVEACDGCGDVRFIPCLTCSGSCKMIGGANEVVRCPDCNENGLIICPVCN